MATTLRYRHLLPICFCLTMGQDKLISLTPLLLWLLYCGRVRLLLALSWGIYSVQAAYPIHALPFQSEKAFPVPTWQLLFVHGVAAGYCRQQLVVLLRGRFRQIVLAGAIVLFLLLSFFALNNPWNDIPGPTRFSLIPESTYGWIYTNFFDRTTLGLGRFVNTLVVAGVLYAALTRFWTPCRATLGWLCVPIGQATLYVFVVHLLFVLGADNLKLLWGDSLIINTLLHTLSIALIWVMVSTGFLFRWIPR